MSFRLTLTACVMAMIGLLAALLIFVQIRTLDRATEDAATTTMDAASRSTVSFLQLQIEMLSRMARTLSFSPAIMQSSDPSDSSLRQVLSREILRSGQHWIASMSATKMVTGCKSSGWTVSEEGSAIALAGRLRRRL